MNLDDVEAQPVRKIAQWRWCRRSVNSCRCLLGFVVVSIDGTAVQEVCEQQRKTFLSPPALQFSEDPSLKYYVIETSRTFPELPC